LTTTTIAYKCFTHDLRPPVRGGDPVWPGTLPHTLPPIAVDESSAACAAGWSACALASDAIRIGGLWPDGRPSRLFRVETEAQVFSRGDKLRASTWNIVEEIRADDAIREMSAKAFAERADVMAAEQLAWRVALARPRRDVAAVEAGLSNALAIRGLDWTLRPFESAWTAWDARSRGAWDAMGASAARQELGRLGRHGRQCRQGRQDRLGCMGRHGCQDRLGRLDRLGRQESGRLGRHGRQCRQGRIARPARPLCRSPQLW